MTYWVKGVTLCSCVDKFRKRNQHRPSTIAYTQIFHGLNKIVNILYILTRTHLLMNELQPDDMKGVNVLNLSLILLIILMAARSLASLVVQHELFSAECQGSLDCVTRVAFDDGHQQFIFRIGKVVGNTVHSAIGEAIPNSVWEINETAGWGEEGSHTSLAIVVAFWWSTVMKGLELILESEFCHWHLDQDQSCRQAAYRLSRWITTRPSKARRHCPWWALRVYQRWQGHWQALEMWWWEDHLHK